MQALVIFKKLQLDPEFFKFCRSNPLAMNMNLAIVGCIFCIEICRNGIGFFPSFLLIVHIFEHPFIQLVDHQLFAV